MSKEKSKPKHLGEPHLSCDAALLVIKKSVRCGRWRIIPYFRMRMEERDFCTLDVERVIRSGAIYEPAEFSDAHSNWKYKIRAPLDGSILEVVIAVDSKEDCDLQPLILPITGYWTGKGTRDGKRTDGDRTRDRRKANKKVR